MFLYLMGNAISIQTVNFEDLQNPHNIILINTLSRNEQTCLIKGTVQISVEEKIINDNIDNKKIDIIIYGKNTNDKTVLKKYEQLKKLGCYNVFVYLGGIFEWLCLQDIYGKELFPTTSMEFDILKFKPISDRITIL